MGLSCIYKLISYLIYLLPIQYLIVKSIRTLRRIEDKYANIIDTQLCRSTKRSNKLI